MFVCFVLVFVLKKFRKAEKLTDEKVLKSIGFPFKMLKTIDKYANEKEVSRADVVRKACDEFIKRNELEN